MAGETIREVVIKIRLEQQNANLEVPDFSAHKQAVTELEAATRKSAESQATAIDRVTAAHDEARGAADKAMREAVLKQAAAANAAVQLGDKVKAAGEGFLTAARGVAFLAASSEEDLAKMVRTIGAVQGGFDMFKGSVETLKGVRDAILASQAASKADTAAKAAQAIANTAVAATAGGAAAGELTLAGAQGTAAGSAGVATVAEGALAAGNTTVAVTGGMAAAAMTALNIALGPVGIGIMAVGALAVGGVAAFKAYGGAASDAGDDLEKLRAQQQDSLDQMKRYVDNIELAGGRLEGVADRSFSASKELAQFQMDAGALPAVERLAQIEGIRAQNKERTLIASRELLRHSNMEGADGVLSRHEVEDFAAGSGSNTLIEGERLEIRKMLSAEAERDAVLARERFELSKLETAHLQSQLGTHLQALAASEQQLAAEKERVRSLDEIVGRLNPAQEAQLKRLGEKVASGQELSVSELKQLEKTGGAGVKDFVQQQYVEQGRERGGADVFAPFQRQTGGDEDDFGQAQRGSDSKLQAIEKELRASKAAAERVSSDIERQVIETSQAVDDVSQKLEAVGSLADSVHRLSEAVDDMIQGRLQGRQF